MASPSDRWTLSPTALDSLLRRLAQDGPDGAMEYERLRRRLIGYLELRGTVAPEAAADETLDRVARKIEAGETVQRLRAYVFAVARHVLMEGQRRDARERHTHQAWVRLTVEEGADDAEHRSHCLEECLGKLPSDSRELVVRYHGHGEGEDRAALALRFGLTPGALRTRMHRLRNELAACLETCLGRRVGGR